MKLIKFRRLNKINWEIAFNEDHLRHKLNGDMAEVQMPSCSLLVRIIRMLFPLKGIEKQLE